MAQDKNAEVVPLYGNKSQPDVTVQWIPTRESDPGAYRRLLELLFLPQPDEQEQPQAEAA